MGFRLTFYLLSYKIVTFFICLYSLFLLSFIYAVLYKAIFFQQLLLNVTYNVEIGKGIMLKFAPENYSTLNPRVNLLSR